MGEFCLDCWNKLNETNDSKHRHLFSWGKDRCEGCGEYKRVVIRERLLSAAQRALAEAIGRKDNG